MKPLLLLEGATKTFFTDKVQTNALSDINLTIFEGEFVTIAGPSVRLTGERMRALGPALLAAAADVALASGGSALFKGRG